MAHCHLATQHLELLELYVREVGASLVPEVYTRVEVAFNPQGMALEVLFPLIGSKSLLKDCLLHLI